MLVTYCSSLSCYLTLEQCLKMSAYAAQILVDAKLIDMKDLDEHRRSTDWHPSKTQ